MIFSEEIIVWYEKNKRDLPWRLTKDPYKIWISEIILQQTRVDQGLPYYIRFLEKFPTIKVLAEASEIEVLNLWQGLGYYSRARNLHFTSKYIIKHYNGIFPSDYSEIRSLKGIGNYTAAAIASFCYNLPYPVLDGNVSRVLTRFLSYEMPINSSKGRKYLELMSEKLMNKEKPDLYNQSIMEFGALQCTPKDPNCGICPLKKLCKSYGTELVNLLPIKTRNLKVRKRYFNYIVIKLDDSTFIKKRNEGIWHSLYEFPLIEGNLELEEIQKSTLWEHLFYGNNFVIEDVSIVMKHKLSHQTIFAKFIIVSIDHINDNDFLRIRWDQLVDYPIPRLIHKYLISQ